MIILILICICFYLQTLKSKSDTARTAELFKAFGPSEILGWPWPRIRQWNFTTLKKIWTAAVFLSLAYGKLKVVLSKYMSCTISDMYWMSHSLSNTCPNWIQEQCNCVVVGCYLGGKEWCLKSFRMLNRHWVLSDVIAMRSRRPKPAFESLGKQVSIEEPSFKSFFGIQQCSHLQLSSGLSFKSWQWIKRLTSRLTCFHSNKVLNTLFCFRALDFVWHC